MLSALSQLQMPGKFSKICISFFFTRYTEVFMLDDYNIIGIAP